MLTGHVIRQQALPARDFGEGLAKFGSRWVALLHLQYVHQDIEVATAHADVSCKSYLPLDGTTAF